MREILFRGKRADNGEWIYGVPLVQERYNYYSIITWEDNLSEFNDYEVIPETVGQYTGLRDKNGKRIFEGDILEYTDSDGDTALYTVIWSGDYAAWVTLSVDISADGDPMDSWDRWQEFYEIIGNIHDNPELLEKEEI